MTASVSCFAPLRSAVSSFGASPPRMHAGVGDLLAVHPDAEDDAAAAGRHGESMPTIDAKRTARPLRSIDRSRSETHRHRVRIRDAAERVDRRRRRRPPARRRARRRGAARRRDRGNRSRRRSAAPPSPGAGVDPARLARRPGHDGRQRQTQPQSRRTYPRPICRLPLRHSIARILPPATAGMDTGIQTGQYWVRAPARRLSRATTTTGRTTVCRAKERSMKFPRHRRITVPLARTIVLAGALFLWSVPVLAQARPERPSDKDVKALIEQVDTGRDKFEGNLDGDFKGSTLRRPTGEVKVAGALQDYQDSPKKLMDRFTSGLLPPVPRWPPCSSSPCSSTRSCRARRAP